MHYTVLLKNDFEQKEVKVQARNHSILVDKLDELMSDGRYDVADCFYDDGKNIDELAFHYEV